MDGRVDTYSAIGLAFFVRNGHYLAHIKHRSTGTWMLCDNNTVRQLRPSDVTSRRDGFPVNILFQRVRSSRQEDIKTSKLKRPTNSTAMIDDSQDSCEELEHQCTECHQNFENEKLYEGHDCTATDQRDMNAQPHTQKKKSGAPVGAQQERESIFYCTLGKDPITTREFMCLAPGGQLTDAIINGVLDCYSRGNFETYTRESAADSFVFTTYLYNRLTDDNLPGENLDLPMGERRYNRVSRFTRRIKLTDQDILIIPIHTDNHWYLTTVTNLKRGAPMITVINSLRGCGQPEKAIELVKEYLRYATGTQEANQTVLTANVTQQDNLTDCGVYVLLFSKFILQNFNRFRVRLVFEMNS